MNEEIDRRAKEMFRKITRDIMTYPPSEETLISSCAALANALVILSIVGVGRERAPDVVSTAVNKAFKDQDERDKNQ